MLRFVGAVYGKAITEQTALVPDPLGAFLHKPLRMTAIEGYGFYFSGCAVDCYYRYIAYDLSCCF